MTKETETAENAEAKKKTATKKAPSKKAATKAAPKKETKAKAPAKKATTAKKPAAEKKETKAKAEKAPAAKKASTKKPAAEKEAPKKEAPKGKIEKFNNELISLEKETMPYCRIKYDAVPSEELWKKAHKDAIKKIAKEVSIPGFRKGKAPESIIMKKHAAQVKSQTESSLADICFKECQKLGKTPLLHGNNNVSFHTEEKDGTKHLFFAFESEPAVPQIKPADFTLEKAKEEKIDAKRIDQEVDSIRGFYSTWEQIEDRPVEMGDFVLLDVDDMDAEEPSRVFNAARFEVKEEKMVTWMRELVLGKNKGDVIDGISQPDDKASEEDKKNFKKKKVRITINSIEKSNLPEVNDQLAKKVGAKNVAEMRERLEKLLHSKNERTAKEAQRVNVEKQLIEKVIFDVPATLLEREANHRMEQLFKNPSFKKQWESDLTEEQKEEKKEEIKEKSAQAIRLFYLCRNIVHENKIPVGDSDMKTNYDSVLDMMYADQQKLQYQSMSEEQKQMALTQVMMHKAEDHIIEQIQKGNSEG